MFCHILKSLVRTIKLKVLNINWVYSVEVRFGCSSSGFLIFIWYNSNNNNNNNNKDNFSLNFNSR